MLNSISKRHPLSGGFTNVSRKASTTKLLPTYQTNLTSMPSLPLTLPPSPPSPPQTSPPSSPILSDGQFEFDPLNESRPNDGKSSTTCQKKNDSRCQVSASRVSSIKN